MDQNELNYYLNVLQKKVNDYFSQSIVLESKINYQNEIITAQNSKIEELERSIQEYKDQIKNLDKKRGVGAKTKSTNSEDWS